MTRPLAALVVAFLLLLAGCSAGSGTPAASETTVPTSTATATGTPTNSPTTTVDPTATPAPTEVEYVVRPGEIPAEFASVRLTFRAVFAERSEEVGRCSPGMLIGPYKPTPTPLEPADGRCVKTDAVTVDLAALDGPRSLGTVTAPGFTSGHGLLVTRVEATLHNGTEVDAIRGIGGIRVLRASNEPEGRHVVRLSLSPADRGDVYDYRLFGEPVEE